MTLGMETFWVDLDVLTLSVVVCINVTLHGLESLGLDGDIHK